MVGVGSMCNYDQNIDSVDMLSFSNAKKAKSNQYKIRNIFKSS